MVILLCLTYHNFVNSISTSCKVCPLKELRYCGVSVAGLVGPVSVFCNTKPTQVANTGLTRYTQKPSQHSLKGRCMLTASRGILKHTFSVTLVYTCEETCKVIMLCTTTTIGPKSVQCIYSDNHVDEFLPKLGVCEAVLCWPGGPVLMSTPTWNGWLLSVRQHNIVRCASPQTWAQSPLLPPGWASSGEKFKGRAPTGQWLCMNG